MAVITRFQCGCMDIMRCQPAVLQGPTFYNRMHIDWPCWMMVCDDTQLMPLPVTLSCFSKIQIGFAFLVLAHPGGPGKGAVKRVCVCTVYRTE